MSGDGEVLLMMGIKSEILAQEKQPPPPRGIVIFPVSRDD